jgi:hypothetical protein
MLGQLPAFFAISGSSGFAAESDPAAAPAEPDPIAAFDPAMSPEPDPIAAADPDPIAFDPAMSAEPIAADPEPVAAGSFFSFLQAVEPMPITAARRMVTVVRMMQSSFRRSCYFFLTVRSCPQSRFTFLLP